jgi:ferredoxin--NADP+ reductase
MKGLFMGLWQKTTIQSIQNWNEHLASFTLDLTLDSMKPGQYINVGVMSEEGKRIKRSYSMASPASNQIELFIVHVEGGLCTSQLFNLKVGDELQYMPRPMGRFTLDRVPEGHTLWLIGSGTGLSPYISMLRSPEVWDRFEHVVLIHGVRYLTDLAYADELNALMQHRSLSYISCVSREDGGDFHGRITTMFENGQLEQQVGRSVSADKSQVMLCGHPQLVHDLKTHFIQRGLEPNRKLNGQITEEMYWVDA